MHALQQQQQQRRRRRRRGKIYVQQLRKYTSTSIPSYTTYPISVCLSIRSSFLVFRRLGFSIYSALLLSSIVRISNVRPSVRLLAALLSTYLCDVYAEL